MKLFVLTALVMTAFAANSVLNRLGIVEGGMTPLDFAAIRLISGAVALLILVALRGQTITLFETRRGVGVVALCAYMIGFSLAYSSLDAGVGALILFGGVQMAIFLFVAAQGTKLPATRWQGAGVALVGLAYLLLPGSVAPDIWGSALMMIAALGWGAYTLAGRDERDPLGATAGNFVWAGLAVLVFAILLPDAGGDRGFGFVGVSAALVSGVVTSAMGYALWYRVLPQLEVSVAGVAQLTVPVLAVLGGALFLGEAVTGSLIFASLLVLGGVAWSLRN